MAEEEWPTNRRERILADRGRMLERALIEAGYISEKELAKVPLPKERVRELLVSILADSIHFAKLHGFELGASDVPIIIKHAQAFCADETTVKDTKR